MGSYPHAGALPLVEPPAIGVIRKARLSVACHAVDAGECRDLLAMLGLLPDAEGPADDEDGPAAEAAAARAAKPHRFYTRGPRRA